MTTAPKASARKAPAAAYAAPSTRRASDIPSGTHSSLLEMQRAVGNHAVSQSMESWGAGVTYREIPYDLQQVLSSDHGRPLDIPIRAIMESRFGRDFTNVRIHTDREAAQTATALNARAYAAGHDIVFAPGQYAPNTVTGQKDLAHELAHVVQQTVSGREARLGTISKRDQFEALADHTAASVTADLRSGEQAPGIREDLAKSRHYGVPPSIQRLPDAEGETIETERHPPTSKLGTLLQKQEKTHAERASNRTGGGPEIRQGIENLKSSTVRQAVEAIVGENSKSSSFSEKVLETRSLGDSLFDATRHIWYVADRLYVIDRAGHVESTSATYPLKGISEALRPGTYFMGQFLGVSGDIVQGNVILLRVKSGGKGLEVFETKAQSAKSEIKATSWLQDVLPLQEQARSALRIRRPTETKQEGNAGIAIIVSARYKEGEPSSSYSPDKLLNAIKGATKHIVRILRTKVLEFGDDPLGETFEKAKNIAIGKLQSVVTDFVPGFGELAGLSQKLEDTAWWANTFNIAARAHGPDEMDLASQIIALKLVEFAIGKLEGEAVKRITAGGGRLLKREGASRKITPPRREASPESEKEGSVSEKAAPPPKKGVTESTATTPEKTPVKPEEQTPKSKAQSPHQKVDVSEETAGDVERSFRHTFSESDVEGSSATPKKGPQKPIGKVKGGQASLTHEEIVASNRVLGKKLGDSDVLSKHWENVANPHEQSHLTDKNSRRMFNNQRRRFWRAVRNDPAARKLFEDAGFEFPKSPTSAPVRRGIPGRFGRVSLDHIERRSDAPTSALDAKNLRFVVHGDNTLLEALQQAIPSLKQGSQEK